MNSGYEGEAWSNCFNDQAYIALAANAYNMRNIYAVDDAALKMFPNAEPATAQKQYARLQAAKGWMHERGLLACVPGSKFVYVSGGMKDGQQ